MESEERDRFLKEMAEIGQLQMKAEEEERHRINVWWNSLDPQTQQDAFYAVVERIHKGDIEDKGTYRYVLYDVFGWGPESYAMGMSCGYMNVHNAIYNQCPHCKKWPDEALEGTDKATPEDSVEMYDGR